MGVVLLHRCCGVIATVAAIAFTTAIAASAVVVTAATTATPTLLPEHQNQYSTSYPKTQDIAQRTDDQTKIQLYSYRAMSLTTDNLINISLGSLSAILALLPCICACIQLYRELLQRRPQRQQRHKKWHGATRTSSFSSQTSLSIAILSSSGNVSTDTLLDDLEAQTAQSNSAVGSFDSDLDLGACGMPALPRAVVYVEWSTHGQPLTGELSGQRR